jgi:hypothetical protein
MFTTKTKRRTINTLFVAFLAIFSISIFISTANNSSISAFALKNELKHHMLNNKFDESESILMLSSETNRNENIVNLEGAESGDPYFPIGDFTNVEYISNKNYFLKNPKHAENDGSDNPAGTCTTVAMQMLMGYHNYYSDRRLIPEIAASGSRFLSTYYGDLASHPFFLIMTM